MVVNKPGKVPVLAGGFFFSNTVIALLQEEYTGHEILAPVHRLGRGTTGALLVAKVILFPPSPFSPPSFLLCSVSPFILVFSSLPLLLLLVLV
jgi:hypothetical protein